MDLTILNFQFNILNILNNILNILTILKWNNCIKFLNLKILIVCVYIHPPVT